MITNDKIKIFKKYNGDIDSWTRNNSKKESLIISDDDWYLIDTLIQDLLLMKKQLISSKFNDSLRKKIEENCENKKVISQLEKLANNINTL